MTLSNALTLATVVFFALILFCWIGNIVLVGRKGNSSLLLSRGLYIFGLAAVLCNLLRVCLIYEGSRGVMITTNVIVFVCILIALIRSERGEQDESES